LVIAVCLSDSTLQRYGLLEKGWNVLSAQSMLNLLHVNPGRSFSISCCFVHEDERWVQKVPQKF
jgi:hypothetical protein